MGQYLLDEDEASCIRTRYHRGIPYFLPRVSRVIHMGSDFQTIEVDFANHM